MKMEGVTVKSVLSALKFLMWERGKTGKGERGQEVMERSKEGMKVERVGRKVERVRRKEGIGNEDRSQ